MTYNTPPSTPRPPGIWSGLGMVVLYFVLQLVVAVLLGIVAGVVYGVVQGMHGQEVSPDALMRLFQRPDVKTMFTVVTMALVAVVMLGIIHRAWRRWWRVAEPPGFGWTPPGDKAWLLYGLLAGIGAVFLGGVLTQLLAQGHAVHQDVTVMSRQVSLGVRCMLALLVVCVAPVVEETIFRGVLLSGLMRHMSTAWAALASALIFGIVHLPDFKLVWYPIPALVILGLVLAWLRLHSRSLWPAVIAHAGNNLMAVLGWFAVTGPHH